MAIHLTEDDRLAALRIMELADIERQAARQRDDTRVVTRCLHVRLLLGEWLRNAPAQTTAVPR